MKQPSTRIRLRHRLPVSLRQHWKLVAALVVAAVVAAAVFGGIRIRPYITGDARVITSSITENINGTVDLFDSSVHHEVEVEIDEIQYRDMISAFENSGDKNWIKSTVTIDGTVITDVGVRLKGNSTLMSLRGDTGMPGGRPDGQGGVPGAAPDRMPGAAPGQMEGPTFPTDGGGFGPAGPGGGPGELGGGVSADEPNTLPLLLRFDKYVDGRAYQGLTELAVRAGSPVLNEAMALSLTAGTDQPSQRYAYAVYSVNGGETATRLLLENPDAAYADSLFESDGYLYKADSSSRLEYVDEDQSSYSDQFKQVNSSQNGTLQPVIDLARWLDGASDEEFDAELAQWVDVESLARYLATQNLLVNTDDMTGPGQNYYLWYDLADTKFTVVSWDLNLAMLSGTSAGPHDPVSMGGAMGGPGGMARPGDIDTDGGPGGSGPVGGGAMGGNQLAERFLASGAFTEIYEEQYWQLCDEIYASGLANRVLDGLASTVPTSDGLTAEALQGDVDTLWRWISQRTAALEELRPA